MLNKIINLINKKNFTDSQNIQVLLGQIQSKLNSEANYEDINDNEFKIFSQWGEDGIIDHLVSNLNIKNKTFIEFGVEDYKEANTRFLLLNKNWSGLIIDSSKKNIKSICDDEIYWRHDLTAVNKFVTIKNINQIIKEKYEGEVGILSIDVDGNDYWIWESIKVIEPSIVVIEYNSRFGKEKRLVVPYNENFDRATAHYSMIYYGSSIRALEDLGKRKGYEFICCNKAGNNAFFVKKNLLTNEIKKKNLTDGFYKNKFRESRDKNGNLSYLNEKEEQDIIFNLPLKEV